MVDQDSGTATSLLSELALMVGQQLPNEATAILGHRVKQAVADRDQTRRVTHQTMADTSTWVQSGRDGRKCLMHTKTPVATEAAKGAGQRAQRSA